MWSILCEAAPGPYVRPPAYAGCLDKLLISAATSELDNRTTTALIDLLSVAVGLRIRLTHQYIC